MRLQSMLVSLVMLLTMAGCGEGLLGVPAMATEEASVADRQAVCRDAAAVWSTVGHASLEQVRDATVALYSVTATTGSATQKLLVGSATTGIGTATGLMTVPEERRSDAGAGVAVGLERFERAMADLDAVCATLGVRVTGDATGVARG